MLNNTILGKQIKAARNKAGMTQEQLAEKLGYTKQNISNWENGKNRPDEETREKLGEILNTKFEIINKKGANQMNVKPFLEINTMEELTATLTLLIDETPVDETFSLAIKSLLMDSLEAVCGYERYKYHFKSKEDREEIDLDWGSIAWTLRSLLDDAEPYPANSPDEISRFCHEKTMIKTKLNQMGFYIGGELFEDFDDSGFRHDYPQLIADSGEEAAYRLINKLPNIENTILTLYKIALSSLADTIDELTGEICY